MGGLCQIMHHIHARCWSINDGSHPYYHLKIRWLPLNLESFQWKGGLTVYRELYRSQPKLGM